MVWGPDLGRLNPGFEPWFGTLVWNLIPKRFRRFLREVLRLFFGLGGRVIWGEEGPPFCKGGGGPTLRARSKFRRIQARLLENTTRKQRSPYQVPVPGPRTRSPPYQVPVPGEKTW